MLAQSRSLSPPWTPVPEYESAKPAKKATAKGTKVSKSTSIKENVLAVLGTRQDLSREQVADILNVVLENLPTTIDKVAYPSEGVSSIHVETWAENKKYKTESIESDWKSNGKSSRAIRDRQLEQQGKYFLIFTGPRSQHYKQVADRIIAQQTAKNEECVVFIQPYSLKEPIEQFVIETHEKMPQASSDPVKERGRTSSKKRGHSPSQSQKQSKLTDYLLK
jgi:hypothetical protein